MTRPGATLRSLAMRLFDPSIMERLIDPVIADLQCEHAEALCRGQVWRSRWIWLAGYVAFWKVAAMTTTTASTRAMRDWAAADGGAVGRTIRFSGLATTVTVGLLVWGPLRLAPHALSGKTALLGLYLIPQALPVALPMGLIVGVLCGLRGRIATRRSRRIIAALALLSSMAMFVDAGWLLPAGNQAFRELLHGGPIARGMNELTLGELASGSTRGRFLPGTMTRRAFEFHFRLALAFAPLALGLFSLGVAAARRRAAGVPFIGAIALASCFADYMLLYFSRFDVSEHVPAIVAAWSPNLVFLASALLLWKLRRREPSAADPSRPGDGRRSEDPPAIPQA